MFLYCCAHDLNAIRISMIKKCGKAMIATDTSHYTRLDNLEMKVPSQMLECIHGKGSRLKRQVQYISRFDQ